MAVPSAATSRRLRELLKEHGPGKTAEMVGLTRFAVMCVAVGVLKVRKTTIMHVEASQVFKGGA